MKLRYHRISILLSFLLLLPLFVCRADDTSSQSPADQSTPSASQDSQTTEGEETVEAAPELYIPDKSFTFKNVPAGQTVTHDFTIHNRGTALLRITRVKTG